MKPDVIESQAFLVRQLIYHRKHRRAETELDVLLLFQEGSGYKFTKAILSHLTALDEVDRNTPLHAAVEGSAPTSLVSKMVKLLGRDTSSVVKLLSASDNNNRTPLHVAACSPNPDTSTLSLLLREYPDCLDDPCSFAGAELTVRELLQMFAAASGRAAKPLQLIDACTACWQRRDRRALTALVGLNMRQEACVHVRVTLLCCFARLERTKDASNLRLKASLLKAPTSPIPLHPRTMLKYYVTNSDTWSVILSFL